MEFTAMVRSVLKLSAGIQLALCSSLGRVRLLLPAGTETHRHVHSWQASPKTCEKPGDSWMLLLQDAFKMCKKGKKKSKKKDRKNTFLHLLSQGHLGRLRKDYSICCPKDYLCVSFYDASHIYTAIEKKRPKSFASATVPVICYCIC